MRIKLDIDCTPEELRGFFGLPDVRGMQGFEKLQEMFLGQMGGQTGGGAGKK